MQGQLYWRLSGFYFFYFIVLGTMVPYLPLYLQSLGLDAWHIGLLTSVMVGTKIVAPNIWGWLADRTQQRMMIIRMGCLMAVLCFSLSFWWHSVAALALIIFLYSFFWNAVLAQFEAVTLAYLGNQPEFYSRIRLWGSIGFIVAVAGLGLLFDHVSLRIFPYVIAAGLLIIFISSWFVADSPQRNAPNRHLQNEPAFTKRLLHPPVLALFSVCFLMVLSHGPYYTFFSVLMEQHQHTRTTIGLLWSLGVVAEIIIFWFMHRLLPQHGLRNLILVSLLATALRWVLLAFFPQQLPVMLFAQCLHAFSFGAFHSAAIEAVRRLFSHHHAGKAQAFYSAVGYGAGNAIGALSSGWLWAISPALLFLCSAVVCLLAFAVSWRYLPESAFADESITN